MKLSAVIDNYIGFKRGLGMRLVSEAAMLRAFSRALGNIDIAQVRPKAVRAFFELKKPVTATLRQYYSVLSSFYRYALGRGFVTSVPLPEKLPQIIPTPPVHYIYTLDELGRLLAATAILHTKWSPWRPRAFCAFLLLLYGTGLRLAEALSLTLRDVDLGNSVITVRQGKFFKSRLVPIGPNLTQALAEYVHFRRHRQPVPDEENSGLLREWPGFPVEPASHANVFPQSLPGGRGFKVRRISSSAASYSRPSPYGRATPYRSVVSGRQGRPASATPAGHLFGTSGRRASAVLPPHDTRATS